MCSRITGMKRIVWLVLALALVSCQTTQTTVHILDGQSIFTFQPSSLGLAALVDQAGLALSPADKIYLNGFELPADYALPPGGTYTLQIHRAVQVTLVTPDGQSTFQSAAATVGQAVSETGLQLYATDFLSPPAGAALNGPLTVTYRPARDLTVSVDGKSMPVKSSAQTVGRALAEAGLPLLGLDRSLPAESEPVPADGQIKIIRVNESVILQEESIPYKTEYQLSEELELDTQNLLQAGETGLAFSRVRARTEDGVEVSREVEPETIVRQPVDRIVGLGTKVVLHEVPGGGGLQYWRAVQMYATSYSPCRSGVPGRCFTGTSIGLPAKKGVVAMIRANYNALAGQRVYIPGYGTAIIGDTGGGHPTYRPWIDLGYSDDDWQSWSSWVTVYFLTPVPPNAAYEIQ
jgi:resuscitation-promoting factor RpfB